MLRNSMNLNHLRWTSPAAPALRLALCPSTRTLEVFVTRTFGAAIGALIFVFFMSYIAERLSNPVQASTARPRVTAQR
jgi:hypothetical protein